MGSSTSKSHSANPSSPAPSDLTSSITSPLLTQQPTYAAHSLLLSVSRLLSGPSLTSKALVVSISAKTAGAIESSSLRPAMLSSCPSEDSNGLYHRKDNSIPRAKFKYPRGGLMEGELRRPTMLDANGEECLIVVKNGISTGVTLGRAT